MNSPRRIAPGARPNSVRAPNDTGDGSLDAKETIVPRRATSPIAADRLAPPTPSRIAS